MKQKEFTEACHFHDWLETRGFKHFHVPNETGGNAKRGALNKRVGVSAGVPDYFIFMPDGTNLAVELKAKDHSNDASKEQEAWLGFLASRGFRCCVAYGFAGARDFVLKFAEDEEQLF